MTQNPLLLRKVEQWGPGVTLPMHIIEKFGCDALGPRRLPEIFNLVYTANNRPMMAHLIDKYASVKTYDDDSDYTWGLVGQLVNNVPLIECRTENGTVVTHSNASDIGVVGRGGIPFQLVFGSEMFAEGESLNHCEKAGHFLFKITDEPVVEGSNVVYNVRLTTGAEFGINAADMIPGKKFSFFGSSVASTLSRKAGGIRKHTTTSMRNEFTTIRKYIKYMGNADKALAMHCSIPVQKNGQVKYINSWFDNETLIYLNEWEQEKQRWLMFGRSNRATNGSYFGWDKSGLADHHGDGMLAQAQYSGVIDYNVFSIKQLLNAIYAKFSMAGEPMNNRRVAIATGEGGMIMFNDAVMQQTLGLTPLTDGTAGSIGMLRKTSNGNGIPNTFGFGGQFTEYQGANGVILTVVHEPMLDDRSFCAMPGFDPQFPMSSYAFLCFDFGSTTKPNIWKCKVAGGDDMHRYRLGLRNPWGINNNNTIQYDEDSAEMHSFTQFGVRIDDPERTLIFKPAGLYL